MTRTRSSRPELTESWDDMGDSYESERPIYDDEEERDEMGEEYRPRTRVNGSRSSIDSGYDTPRRRNLRSSPAPELVMPSSPDGGAAKKRASTPHMRMNQRSLTSDAGEIRRQQRSSTPRMRMSERSMTGDAGRFRGSRLKEHDEADYESEEEAGQTASMIWNRAVRPLLTYALDIVGLMLNNLKPIIAMAFLGYVLIAAVFFAAGFVNNSITTALSPICRLPFTGSLPFCPSTSNTPGAQGNAEFAALVEAQDQFSEILQNTQVGTTLPLDMKRSEASIRDLKNVVEYSSLPSKNELVFEFSGFIETARETSRDLSKFNARIGRAVDHILSTNRWTLSVIDGVKESDAAQGSLTRWVNSNLNIFSPFQPASPGSQTILLDQYLKHTGAIEEQITGLISEAQALLTALENMDNRLGLIASISTRDGIKLSTSKDELFSTLWTKLGGNKASVAKLNNQINLLNSVSAYRRAAWGHVTATLLKLQQIQGTLEDLRERVALPETVGTDKIPLEVHIQSINLGIERLEAQRDESRRVEKLSYDRAVGRGGEGRMIEGGTGKVREL